MPVSGEKFLEAADTIYKKNESREEIYYRCSASRAYYAAFHVAKKHFHLPRKTRHITVIDILKKNHRSTGEKLKELKELREDADYELDKYISQYIADKCIKLSNNIINKLNNLKT